MTNTELVASLMENLEKGNFDTADNLMADYFNLELPIPFPIGKPQLLMFLKLFKTALPDWAYNFKVVSEEGNLVKGEIRPFGTHTIDFSFPGLPAIAASNKQFSLPAFSVEFVVENEKIVKMKFPNLPLFDIATQLKDIGVSLPGM